MSENLSTPLSLTASIGQANILIDMSGRACLADFGLLTILSNTTILSSCGQGGTIRWMSPELLDLEMFGLKDSRRTKSSDCYALGMVIYKVLSGQVPFPRYSDYTPVAKVLRGERPERPQGVELKWFTDDVWSVLGRCWEPKPNDRPSIEDTLQCLVEASRIWVPLPPLVVEGSPTAGSPTWTLSDMSEEESMVVE